MKKQLMGVALSALMFAAAAEAKFDGAFAGASVGYKWETLKGKETDSSTRATFKPADLDGSLTGGYGETMGSLYVGGDVRAGYSWAKKKQTITYNATPLDLTVKNAWNAGVGLLLGNECAPDCLVFFRLGLDYNNYKFSETVSAVNLNKKFRSWAVVPGLGVKWKLDKDWYVSGMYEYSHAFAVSKPVSDLKVTQLTSHGLKIGVGYQF